LQNTQTGTSTETKQVTTTTPTTNTNQGTETIIQEETTTVETTTETTSTSTAQSVVNPVWKIILYFIGGNANDDLEAAYGLGLIAFVFAVVGFSLLIYKKGHSDSDGD